MEAEVLGIAAVVVQWHAVSPLQIRWRRRVVHGAAVLSSHERRLGQHLVQHVLEAVAARGVGDHDGFVHVEVEHESWLHGGCEAGHLVLQHARCLVAGRALSRSMW